MGTSAASQSDMYQQSQHAQNAHDSQHVRSDQHSFGHVQNRTQSPSAGLVPDPVFVNSLRSIDGTGTSGQGQLEGPTENEAVVAETIVRARKSWKTVKGRSEVVWPPHLERVLIQALLQYKPNDARYTRALGRFPKRNRFISDYIFSVTGIRRSPKQVGSRLQQLKDVSCGKMLLNHVASWSQTTSSAPVSASGSPLGLDLPLESQSDLELITNELHGLASGSEGSQSPVTPIGGIDQALYFAHPSAPSADVLDSMAAMQLAFPHLNWFSEGQCKSGPSLC
ncbi:uncharacterized protein FOMMEDRAFT_16696 [Fomitiporia mediterranea MF3/22]|uniref:uncharacterized protein n=1 Tax=Fomitiporia mediterranea (strain MF3/22) TaxID=694068 RepID=UPI0004408D8E|nr:uncharacterized protein FOMMEDRAFT_16696 [Fomitiporia mediterranea MF3/22]EJD08266.1 hypothetical protein FOMMEDRAFT_16696 [Fomitiporia mediterranea MF3/22]